MFVLHTSIFSGLGKGGGGPISVMANLKIHNQTKQFCYECLFSFNTDNKISFQQSRTFNFITFLRSHIKQLETVILFLLILKYFFKLRSYLQVNNVDIIHFHDVLSAYVFSKINKSSNRIKSILTIQSVGPFYNEFPLFSNEKISYFFLKHMEEAAIKKITLVTFPSKGARSIYLKALDSSTRKLLIRKSDIVYNAIDIDTVNKIISKKDNAAFYQYFHMNKADFNIICVARLHRSKGVDRIPNIAKKFPHFNFILVGSGVMKTQIQSSITQNKIANLYLVDKLERSTLLRAIMFSDLFMMVSKTTVFDLVMLEAMALGKIILATDIPGHDEMIISGVNGYLENIDNFPKTILKIQKLSKEKRNQIKKAAVKTVLNSFSPKTIMKSYEKLYLQLAK